MVATTWLVSGSIRVTVPNSGSTVQIEPKAAVTSEMAGWRSSLGAGRS